MRVLFSSTSGFGHVLPMVPLARAFASAGHDVLWATGADACGLVTEAGLVATPAGLSGRGLGEARGEVLRRAAQVAPQERAAFTFPRMFGAAFTPPMVSDLLPLAESWRADLLVHEHAELASPLVGAVLGVPSHTHAFGGAVPAVILAAAGDRVRHVWAGHSREVPPYAGCFTSTYLDICPPSVQAVPTDHIPSTQALRPVADAETGAAPLPDYLAPGERPLVYLTLGTVQNDVTRLRVVAEAIAGLPVRLLVAVGPGSDPGALGGLPATVHVEPWVDQPLVLGHCTMVVSHSGSGTFLGALARGLPQLCLPQAADQFRNAEGGVRAGAAIALTPRETTPTSVSEAVGRLLGDDAFRRGAAAVADEIRAMPSSAEVVQVLTGAG